MLVTSRFPSLPQTLHMAALFLVAAGPVALWPTRAAAREPARDDRAAAADQVCRILVSEAAGELPERRAALQALPSQAAAVELFHWTTGNIRWEQKWVPFEAVVNDPLYQEKLREYRRMRAAEVEAQPSRPESLIHRRLANWCRRQELAEQEWLHWTKVVESDASDLSAHARLGNEWIAGKWYSRSDIAAAKAQSRKISENLETWLPRLKPILVAHSSPDSNKRATVAGRLPQLAHPDAVPAIRVALLVADEPMARKLLEILGEIGTPDAAIVLTQVALADPYSPLGDAAIKQLHEMPAEFYVPALLGALASPITHALAIMEGSNGQLMLQQALFRETESHRSVQRLLKTIHFDVRQVNLGDSVAAFIALDARGVNRTSSRLGGAAQSSVSRPFPADRQLSYEEKLARRAAQAELRSDAMLQKDQGRCRECPHAGPQSPHLSCVEPDHGGPGAAGSPGVVGMVV